MELQIVLEQKEASATSQYRENKLASNTNY